MPRRPPAAALKATGGEGKRKQSFGPFDIAEDFESEAAKAPLYASALAILCFAVYAKTAYPTVPPGDAGELCHTVCSGGNMHPPGYPLYLLLARLFQLIPLGNSAYRTNLVSCFAGALSIAFVALFCQRWYGHRGLRESASLALLPAGLVAFAPLFWLYHTQAEVFSLNNAVIAAAYYVAHLHREACTGITDENRALKARRSLLYARLGAFVVGLGLSNQHACLFYMLPIVTHALLLDLYSHQGLLPDPAGFASLVACGLVGLSPYAYTAYQAYYPRGAGGWGDQRTIAGLLTHLLREEYGTFQLYSGSDAERTGLHTVLLLYAESLARNTLWAGAALGAAGLVACFAGQRRDSFGLLLASSLSFYWVVFHLLANLPLSDPLFLGVQMRFWMQAHIVMAALIVPGAVSLPPLLDLPPPPLPRGAVGPLALAAVALQAALHYRVSDQGGNRFFEEYAKSAFESFPKGAIVLTKGDNSINLLRYMQVCEGYRPDVQLVDQSMMSFAWYVPTQQRYLPKVRFPAKRMWLRHTHVKPRGAHYIIEDFLEENLKGAEQGENGGVFVFGGWHQAHKVQDTAFHGPTGFKSVPAGLCERIVRTKDFFPGDEGLAELILENDMLGVREKTRGRLPSLPKDLNLYDSASWERSVFSHVLQGKQRFGHYLLMWAQENGDPPKALELSIAASRETVAEWPREEEHKTSLMHRSIAIAMSRLKNVRKQEPREDANTAGIIHHFKKYRELERKLDTSSEIRIIEAFEKYPNAAIDIKMEI